MSVQQLFDHYSFRARLQPALLTLLPVALAIFAWTGPGVKWESALWTLFGTVGGTFFLAILARNFGKRLEPSLWNLWGGAPTSQLLRHTGPGNPVLRERWHRYLAKLLGKPLPTPQEEQVDPQAADEIYDAGVKLVINKTRDIKKFHLLYKENVQYGYCRNLLGLRHIGLTFSALGAAVCISSGLWNAHLTDNKVYPWVCLVANVTLLYWWTFTIDATWVKVPAFAYAERLLEATEKLPQIKKPREDKGNGANANA